MKQVTQWLSRATLFGAGLALSLTGALAKAPDAAMSAPANVATQSATEAPASAVAASNGSASAAPVSASPADAVAPADPLNLKPEPGIGQPTSDFWGSMQLQPQVTKNGRFAAWLDDSILLPLITIISLFVVFLLLWVMARYNRRANPTPSRTSHNTLIEVIWTAVPAIILMGVFLPSFKLLRDQFAPAGSNAVVIKATGHQWYWTYKYPDNGDFEITSKILPDDVANARGEPRNLGVDNRILVPINTEVEVLTTSDDVIHSWSVPAFWTKMDAIPGRVNETSFTADRIGVYYGQCDQLCGTLHGFMPIAVEVVTKARFDQWIAAHGGHAKGAQGAPSAATAPTNGTNATISVKGDMASNVAAPAANSAAPAATANTASK